MTVTEAARLMGVSEEFIRAGIRQQVFPWGYAVRVNSRYSYWINREKFMEDIRG